MNARPVSLRRGVPVAIAALALLLAGCGDRQASGKPVVAATAPQLDALVSALAGPGIEQADVVPATADLHDLELRPSQVRALRDADLIVRPGHGGDRWAQQAIDVADGAQLDAGAGVAGTERHWWMDPRAAIEAARAIASRLDQLDPGGLTERRTALEELTAELRALDRETARCLATVAEERRAIVTDHDAAGAFARRYGLRIAATVAPGADPEAAPSAKRVVELLATMKRERVAAVFPIAPHGGELAATLARRAGADLGEPLWADALPGDGDEHDHEHGATGDAHESDASTGGAGLSALLDAAHRNAHAAAEALGADPAVCGDLLG